MGDLAARVGLRLTNDVLDHGSPAHTRQVGLHRCAAIAVLPGQPDVCLGRMCQFVSVAMLRNLYQ